MFVCAWNTFERCGPTSHWISFSNVSIVFVISFVGVSSKPSPIYGGLGLIVGGGVGCGIEIGRASCRERV